MNVPPDAPGLRRYAAPFTESKTSATPSFAYACTTTWIGARRSHFRVVLRQHAGTLALRAGDPEPGASTEAADETVLVTADRVERKADETIASVTTVPSEPSAPTQISAPSEPSEPWDDWLG